MALADLAKEVATREGGPPIPDLPAENVERVYLSLRNLHLPRLVDEGIVEYDSERELVALSTEGECATPFLDTVVDEE